MIPELLAQAKSACHAAGDLLEVHISRQGEIRVKGVVDVREFAETFWDEIQVLDHPATRRQFCRYADDTIHVGVVHPDGAYVVTLFNNGQPVRPTP